MENRRRTILIACILAVVLIASGVGYALLAKDLAGSNQTSTPSSQAGQDKAIRLADHDATVYTATDEAVTLSSIANGRPLVINFWATWCPYCVKELPDLQDIAEEYADTVAFAFVDVTDGQRERKDDARAWLEQNGLAELPVYYDTSLEAATSWGAHALPLTVVIDANGEVATSATGMIDPTLLRGALTALA
ncbi:MAG: TlpA family protein disulfide reductase [Atopobiaceae bacterium]|nr:TlpA family protein disulfide reductase [Atopobiaceae bacterium]